MIIKRSLTLRTRYEGAKNQAKDSGDVHTSSIAGEGIIIFYWCSCERQFLILNPNRPFKEAH